MCTVFDFLAAGPLPTPIFTSNRISGFILVAFMNGLMTFYTYFKDYEGDKAIEPTSAWPPISVPVWPGKSP